MSNFAQIRSYVYSWLLLCIVLFPCYASHGQVNSKYGKHVTVSSRRISIGDLFKSIRKQTGLTVMISTTVTEMNLSEKVSVNFLNASIDQVMLELLKKKGTLTYSLVDDGVLILKKYRQGDKTRMDSSSQNLNITGRVVDFAGGSIIGATVRENGTSNGTMTNQNGIYSITVKAGSTIIISSVGYSTVERRVINQTVLNITLADYTSELDQVQIIAYGTITKKLLTGNISSVKAKDIEKQPVNNPLLALQGRAPGVYIEQQTGNAGGGVKVRIQGNNSIRNGNNPLYVIDGVPYTSVLLPSISDVLGSNSGALGGQAVITEGAGSPMNFINPAQIESIEILKDADATAIYGSRAANGVILITTKGGQAGRTKININMQTGFGKVSRRLNVMNTQQYLDLRNDAKRIDNAPVSPFEYDINGTYDLKKNTDWQKELIGGTAGYHDIQAAISGGSENTQFNLGAGYHRETTVYPGNFSDTKGSVNFNINHLSTNRRFRVQLTGSYMKDLNKLLTKDITIDALVTPPNAPALYNEDGGINWGELPDGSVTFMSTPASYLASPYKNTTSNLIANVQLTYVILPGLNFKNSFGYNDLRSEEKAFNTLTSIPPNIRPFVPATAKYGTRLINSWIAEPQLVLLKNTTFGNFDAIIGTTFQQNNADMTSYNGTGYRTDQEMDNIAAASSLVVGNKLSSNYKYNAFFGRINYNWKEKYILNLSARRDGSSRFGSENRFQNFYALGGAWIFTEEKSIKDNLPFINFGKLRLSYGTTGNDQIGDYQFLSLYTKVNAADIPYQGVPGLMPASLASPFIQWEVTRKFNAGLDLNFWNNKMQISANFYNNRSSHQLLPYPLPEVTGFTDVLRNIPATIQNRGFEFLINTTIIKTNNFSWESTCNFTLPKNRLVKFPDLESSTYANLLVIGQPTNIVKVYQSAGVNQQTGLYEFIDHEGKVTSYPDQNTDLSQIVNLDPKYFGGWGNSFSYKSLTLDFLFQFAKQMGANYFQSAYLPGLMGSNHPSDLVDRWRNPGDISAIQKANQNFAAFLPFLNHRTSDAAYSDASYIRLKNVSLGFNLPSSWLKKTKIFKFQIYLQGQNLWTITNYTGLDPENRNLYFLPALKTVTAGIRCTL